MSWDSRFAQPLELPDGAKLASLREAIVHLVNTIPSSERGMPVVLTAVELLTNAAENDVPIEFARIATLRAINRNVKRVFDLTRKDPHWGRRKLKKDQSEPADEETERTPSDVHAIVRSRCQNATRDRNQMRRVEL